MAKARIMIVEDDLIIARDLKSFLTNAGYAVLGVFSEGEEAVKQIIRINPDIVLMDITLKGKMDGIETADSIMEMLDVPIVFLTASMDDQTIEKAKRAEPYGYIIKPFHEKELQTTIEMALYKHEKDLLVKKERDLYHSVIETRQGTDSIYIKTDFQLIRINFEEIYYIESQSDNIIVYTKNETFNTTSSLKDVIKLLPEKDFVRIHRSFIIRVDKIFSIKFPELIMEGKKKVLPIGENYKKELFDRLNLI